jgi:p24 family protein delta-1
MARTQPSSLSLAGWLLVALLVTLPTRAIKFQLPAARFPSAKCVWNQAHDNSLVIVTANVSPGDNMRVDVEIVDSSEKKNVYLHKRGIVGETRLAVTTHAEGEVGVCFRNYLSSGVCFTTSMPRNNVKTILRHIKVRRTTKVPHR